MDLGEGRDTALDVTLGDRVEVVLRRGSATGHLWQLDLPDDRCRLVDHQVHSGAAGTFGGQQDEVFVLEATREGTTAVTLSLGRPWEDAPVRTAVVTLQVGADDDA